MSARKFWFEKEIEMLEMATSLNHRKTQWKKHPRHSQKTKCESPKREGTKTNTKDREYTATLRWRYCRNILKSIEIGIQTQGGISTSNRQDQWRIHPWCTLVKMSKMQSKETTLKAAGENANSSTKAETSAQHQQPSRSGHHGNQRSTIQPLWVRLSCWPGAHHIG